MYTASTPSNFWRKIFYYRKDNIKWRKEFAIFNAFKRRAEIELGSKISFKVNRGNQKKNVLNYANFINADTIVLKTEFKYSKWYFINEPPVAYLLRKSNCQTITLFTNNSSIYSWQNVVLPVSSFIPRTQLQIIIKAARSFKIKIHLIGTDHTNEGFYFLTETLKILKSTGNIKVECQYLNIMYNDVSGLFKYCDLVNADALITSERVKNEYKKYGLAKFKDMLLHFRYPQPAKPLLQM